MTAKFKVVPVKVAQKKKVQRKKEKNILYLDIRNISYLLDACAFKSHTDLRIIIQKLIFKSKAMYRKDFQGNADRFVPPTWPHCSSVLSAVIEADVSKMINTRLKCRIIQENY